MDRLRHPLAIVALIAGIGLFGIARVQPLQARVHADRSRCAAATRAIQDAQRATAPPSSQMQGSVVPEVRGAGAALPAPAAERGLAPAPAAMLPPAAAPPPLAPRGPPVH